ncbi:HDOD domain-containing protein [Simiduia aestuariiviva]|uniref:HD-like signal output (HDOD) protein n=1 Tax=Simiduia aestuariiviva TaxID=1510459 RepID=A0A839UK56_9GAMM|nr:HDOD domain-containing protein [Simiduia aestuariiviva]MBB3166979.1 HD-like signal output (HDOD) protein [Simiduia aestuariiviva]
MAVKGVDAWVSKLNAVDLPVLGSVVKTLNQLTTSDDTRVNQLSDVVLKDSNLTSQLLRAANSIHFNPSGGNINTITRAIIQVGFEGVKNICISLLLVDQLLGANPRTRLLQVMAKAFHAALQAKAMLPGGTPDEREEVFIAALLFHVGELAIWSKGEAQADELDRQLSEGVEEAEACAQVLSLQFKQLTRALVKHWHLSALLDQTLAQPQPRNPTPLMVAVKLGDALSAASRYGWDTPDTAKVLKKIAEYRKVSFKVAKEDAQKVAEQAADVVSVFGAENISRLIPKAGRAPDIGVPTEPDVSVQLKVLRDLSNAVQQGTDVNTLFQIVMEGLYKGVGLPRVGVLLVVRDQLLMRYALGTQANLWREKLMVKIDEVNFFSEALCYKSSQHFDAERLKKCAHLFTPLLQDLLGGHPCVIAPIEISGRTTALFYADKTGLAISEDQQAAFGHFAMQAQQSLAAMALKKRR